MSTNHTTNYDLNQWEGTDKVLRTEFNADNSKIDAALKANADAIALKADAADVTALEAELEALANRSRFTKLKEVTVQANTLTVEIDLSDMDWSQWDKVHLDAITNNVDQAALYYNSTESENWRFTLGGTHDPVHRPRLTFRVGHDTQRLVDAQWGGEHYLDEQVYSQLSKLIIFGDTMGPGAVFTLWGEK